MPDMVEGQTNRQGRQLAATHAIQAQAIDRALKSIALENQPTKTILELKSHNLSAIAQLTQVTTQCLHGCNVFHPDIRHLTQSSEIVLQLPDPNGPGQMIVAQLIKKLAGLLIGKQ